MQILVTGAAGFIGSHLCESLLARGDEVVAIDNLDDYYSPEIKRETLHQLQHAQGAERFRFVELDVRDKDGVQSLFETHRFDAVAHLAGMAGVRNSVEHAALYLNVNVLGTQHLLDAACRGPLPGAFVFASTSSVYGATREIPFLETDPCGLPLTPYAASKRSAELLGHTHHHLHRLSFTALRFFTVYGPRNRPDMMAHLLLDSISEGRAVKLYRGGQMWRDWTYVDDVVRGVVAALDRPMGFAIFNLGRGNPILLSDFVKRLEELGRGKANLQDAAMPASDVTTTYASIDHARRMLGYEPRTSLEEGTEALFRWYERR